MDKIDIKQINAYLDNVEADLMEQELDNVGPVNVYFDEHFAGQCW